MKKIFWFLYARIRLWYLYRGDIPCWDKPDYYHCPNCFWDSTNADFNDDCYLGSVHNGWGYEGNEYFTEHWKCPRCGTKFDVEDSSF